MPLVKDEAIVLAKMPYSESDRIVRLFTLKEGKISGIAKGGMRSQRRFMNTLEPFNLVRIEFVEKGRGLVRIENADIVETNYGIERSIASLSAASVFVELADRLTKEKEASSILFEILKEALKEVKEKELAISRVLFYVLRILEVQGYLPNFSTCVFCNAKVERRIYFSKQRGGILCSECARFIPHRVYGPFTIDGLLKVAKGLEAERNDQLESEAMEMVEEFMEFHLGLRLKSLRVLRGLRSSL